MSRWGGKKAGEVVQKLSVPAGSSEQCQGGSGAMEVDDPFATMCSDANGGTGSSGYKTGDGACMEPKQ